MDDQVFVMDLSTDMKRLRTQRLIHAVERLGGILLRLVAFTGLTGLAVLLSFEQASKWLEAAVLWLSPYFERLIG